MLMAQCFFAHQVAGLNWSNKMKTEYYIVRDDKLNMVQMEVNERLAKGWTLQGGIAIAYSTSQGYVSELYAQAMIKESK